MNHKKGEEKMIEVQTITEIELHGMRDRVKFQMTFQIKNGQN